MRSAAAVPLLALALAGCDSGLPTHTPFDVSAVEGDAPVGSDGPAFDGSCGECTFEPRLYTRATGTPVTDVITFAGHPDGAYILETDDFGDRGAESRLVLNGDTIRTPVGLHRRDVVLANDNEMRVRLTGKPGSRLRVRIFQEIESVDVAPAAPRARIPATQQFTATARDRNGVEIPRVVFEWESAADTIVSIDAASGLARSVGLRHQNASWSYVTTSLGTGSVQVTARPTDRPDRSGAATWSLVSGFVYTTYRAPRRLNDDEGERPDSQPFSYDEARLQTMAATCTSESANTRWWSDPPGEKQYRQCYPELEQSTPYRERILGVYIPGAPRPNVGLYGRYCGAGQPGGPSEDPTSFIVQARNGNYQPKDPIDAVCMEHDRASEHHHERSSSSQGACIVRYGIETETLDEDGVRVAPGSARWDAFWARWPDMAEAREHWLVWTRPLCSDSEYARFLEARGLE